MIITRTPFRVTLGGGGTDLPSYYSRHGGFIFAAAISRYMFINVNRPVVDDLVRVKYTRSEIVSHRDAVQHEIAREALRLVGIECGVEIVSMADVPAGTGLGSSSCYAVGLLNALHAMRRQPVTYHELAEEACRLELDILKKPIGKQDDASTYQSIDMAVDADADQSKLDELEALARQRCPAVYVLSHEVPLIAEVKRG